jgi:hypothetical protein
VSSNRNVVRKRSRAAQKAADAADGNGVTGERSGGLVAVVVIALIVAVIVRR